MKSAAGVGAELLLPRINGNSAAIEIMGADPVFSPGRVPNPAGVAGARSREELRALLRCGNARPLRPRERMLAEIGTKDRLVDAATLRYELTLAQALFGKYAKALGGLAADVEHEERDAARANSKQEQSLLFPTEADALFASERGLLEIAQKALNHLRIHWWLDEE